MTVENEEQDCYFVQAIEAYNVRDSNGRDLLQIYRGQYFKWSRKTIDVELDGGCMGCSKTKELHTITGRFNCEEGFKNAEGQEIEYVVPSYVFTETSDTEDDNVVCESWFHETGGYNKDLFIPPHLRDDEQNNEWRKNNPPKAY
jgi:hypothetical protein